MSGWVEGGYIRLLAVTPSQLACRARLQSLTGHWWDKGRKEGTDSYSKSPANFESVVRLSAGLLPLAFPSIGECEVDLKMQQIMLLFLLLLFCRSGLILYCFALWGVMGRSEAKASFQVHPGGDSREQRDRSHMHYYTVGQGVKRRNIERYRIIFF